MSVPDPELTHPQQLRRVHRRVKRMSAQHAAHKESAQAQAEALYAARAKAQPKGSG